MSVWTLPVGPVFRVSMLRAPTLVVVCRDGRAKTARKVVMFFAYIGTMLVKMLSKFLDETYGFYEIKRTNLTFS